MKEKFLSELLSNLNDKEDKNVEMIRKELDQKFNYTFRYTKYTLVAAITGLVLLCLYMIQ